MPESKVSALSPNCQTGSINCKQGAVRAVRFNVDGNYCITCGSDKSLKLWNPFKRILLKTYNGHGYEVLDAMGSCDNSQIVSCGMDKAIIVWDVGSGSSVRRWRAHAGTVNAVHFNENSSVIMSGSVDGSVKCWDVRSKRNEPIQSMEESKDSVTSLDVSDHEILVGSADQRVRRYDLRNGHLCTDFIGSSITSISFTNDGQCFIVSSSKDSVKLMDKSTGEMLQEFLGHKNSSNYRLESVLNNTDQLVISGSEDGFVYIWDILEGKIVDKLFHSSESGNTVHSLSFHPKETMLLTASKNMMYIWKNQANIEID